MVSSWCLQFSQVSQGLGWWDKNLRSAKINWNAESHFLIWLNRRWIVCHPAQPAAPQEAFSPGLMKNEWELIDRSSLTRCDGWRHAVTVEPRLMLQRTPLESPTWAGLYVIFIKAYLLANWIICTRGTDPAECPLCLSYVRPIMLIHVGSVDTPGGIQDCCTALTLICAGMEEDNLSFDAGQAFSPECSLWPAHWGKWPKWKWFSCLLTPSPPLAFLYRCLSIFG